MLTRRQFSIGATSIAALTGAPAYGQAPRPDGRIAMVDAPVNVSEYVERLKANGVTAIGRYFARKAQPELGLPHKRIAFEKAPNGQTEADFIKSYGINIHSVYQYYSGGDGSKFLFGRKDTETPKKEAQEDAKAAVEQAKLINQPEGTAIYFGVDYNCVKGAKGPGGKPQIEFIIDYFRIINAQVGGHYRIGTYANGYVNRILRKEGLISLSWISPSASYDETTQYISDGDWHLFQNQVDRRWYETSSCPSGLDLDTNLQKGTGDVGLWGGDPIPSDRTTAIYGQRRFAKEKAPIFKAAGGGALIDKTRCVQVDKVIAGKKTKVWASVKEDHVLRLHNVRVLEISGEWLHVDVDDDGRPDGYCHAKYFTQDLDKMPPWKV
jgi:hypothetical protein